MPTVSVRIFDLNPPVEESLPILRRLIGENITLIWFPKVKDALVKLDPSQIIQILTNLCVNARDAISGNGTITIETNTIHVDQANINTGHTCTIPGDYITLSITDNGHGIDTQHLPHIIEPFFTTKEVGKGSGMGLATVYGIVKQGNGFIDIESEKGKGTTIIIYLPLQQEQSLLVNGPIEEPELPHGKGMILLVEDQPDILQLCRKMLEHQGYTVLAASGPLEAITLAKEKRKNIDLLVTDVIMPEMNGSDLFKKIAPICPKLHVLYMSGFPAEYIGKQLRGDEGVNFIEKPFSITALTKIVHDILKKRPEK
ncbi:MAG: ATP-binding protein [Chlorobiales bacterium]|nr:ATP-binding protein [Chlorobiales bacterium]